MIKSWKTFAVIAVLILVLAFVLKNFGFILGFLVGGGLVWFYGKENIQKKFNQAVEKTKGFAAGMEEKIMPPSTEELTIATSSATALPTQPGWYQISLLAYSENKGKTVAILLQPSKSATVPALLNSGHSIKVVTAYHMENLTPVKTVTVIDENNTTYPAQVYGRQESNP